jgi:hypothetical protein
VVPACPPDCPNEKPLLPDSPALSSWSEEEEAEEECL